MEPSCLKGPQEVPLLRFPPIAQPLHVCDIEHSRATLCLTCLHGRSPTPPRCRGHLKIVAAFLNCLFALGHPEMAVLQATLQVAAGIRIQGLTETFLSVWFDQVDGTALYSLQGQCGQVQCFLKGHRV